MTDLPRSIAQIDIHHLGRPHVVASYLLEGGAPVIVDPGPTSDLPNLERGLAGRGLGLGDLQALLLTHIHLDHAGAAGAIVARYPHITVYVHERGAPHLIDPSKLLASAQRIYGDQLDALYGAFLPVPQANVAALRGGETLDLAGRDLDVLYTPGHASHHVSYIDTQTGAAFVGDTAGIRMPGFGYARPATPPPDIDLERWRASIDAILARDPALLLLTHFGAVGEPQRHFDALWANTQSWAETVRDSLAAGDDEQTAIARLQIVAGAEIGDDASDAARAAYSYAAAVPMSWQGLARYWRKRPDAA